jgi:heptosyltransferase III
MSDQLVPAQLLQESDKILFITHLAIGDFTYMQNYFRAFSQLYPNTKIHVWVDEVRRTRCFWRWKHLKNYALYDWLQESPYIEKVYCKTYSPQALRESISQARKENYPVVASLATLRGLQYARLARAISPHGFVAVLQDSVSIFDIRSRFILWRANPSIALPLRSTYEKGKHISDVYATWFERFFNVYVPKNERFPFVDVPRKWLTFAKLRFLKLGIDKRSKRFGKVFFINAYAKSEKRTWPLERVFELITAIKQDDVWGDVSFIVNVVPEHYDDAKRVADQQSLTNTYLYSTAHNFFQLPAMISQCDLVISVETAVMHLANAVHVPVIALMRTKNPEWVPIDDQNSIVITTDHRNAWVRDIPIKRVLDALAMFSSRLVVKDQASSQQSIPSQQASSL